MLEGFMDSVRALTEVDTESFIKNFPLQSLLKKEKNDPFSSSKIIDADVANHLTAPEDGKPDEIQAAVPGKSSSGSFFKKIGGLLRKMAAKIPCRE